MLSLQGILVVVLFYYGPWGGGGGIVNNSGNSICVKGGKGKGNHCNILTYVALRFNLFPLPHQPQAVKLNTAPDEVIGLVVCGGTHTCVPTRQFN